MKPVPQILLALLWLLSLVDYARDHGKPRIGRESFWRALLIFSIQTLLLWLGGWFS